MRNETNEVKFGKMAEGAMETPEEFIKHLSNEPNLYWHILKRLRNKDDEYVCEVLKRARQQGIVWKDESLWWHKELEIFLSGKKGPLVFKEWLSIPSVHQIARTQVDGATRTIMLQNPKGLWDSLGHALAALKLSDHLQVLLKAIPGCSYLMVSDLLLIKI